MIRRTLSRLDAGVGLLVVAAAFGLLAAVLTFQFVRSSGDNAGAAGAGKLVVVARTDIRAGDTLTNAAVHIVEVPGDRVAAGALTTTADAVNRVARYPLVAGEQILASKLVDSQNGDALAFAVPENMRAVAVPFSAVMGAGGLVVPGDHVDVLVYTEYRNLFGPNEVTPAATQGNATVLTLLQNVLVLALDRSYASPAAVAGDGAMRPRASDTTAQARTVTLATSPEDAQLLFLATQKGTLGLAMRRFGDQTERPIGPEFRLRASTDSALGAQLPGPGR